MTGFFIPLRHHRGPMADSGYGSSFSSGTLRVGRSGFPIRPDLWYNGSRPRERNEIMTKEEALKTYFGYDDFRGGQESIIDALLAPHAARLDGVKAGS